MSKLCPRLRKKRNYFKNRKQFVQKSTDEIYSGHFNGFCVVINDPEHVKRVYNFGFYGKGNLSRSYPKFEFDTESESNVINVKETLNLMLEEAYYLTTELKCLKIYYNNKLLNANEMWNLFIESQSNFVQNYVVYHYFRTRDWVLKTGLKFGGDFLLYKDGPPFYHASYLVLIDVIFNNTLKRNVDVCKRSMDWISLIGLNRIAETAAKDILICQVMWPDDLTSEQLKQLKDPIITFPVKTVLIKRWIAKQERIL